MHCARGEVHVWRVELDDLLARRAALEHVLSDDERERAGRLRSSELRDRWTVARVALRFILASYAGVPPASLVFDVGTYGKPALRDPSAPFSFNVTHTGNRTLVAVAGSTTVGIDAEVLRTCTGWQDLSRRFFARSEAEDIESLPPEQQLAAFFACWTRKEAILKAGGVGLAAPLNAFCVTVLPHRPIEVRAIASTFGGSCMSLIDLSDRNVAAALAVDIASPVIRRLDFVA
jgi:4'-phosphopantetheinyl transferase